MNKHHKPERYEPMARSFGGPWLYGQVQAVVKTAKTPQEARAKPGLKLITPLEKEMIDHKVKLHRERWAALFNAVRNKWRAGK